MLRGSLHVEAAHLGVLARLGELRDLADAADLDARPPRATPSGTRLVRRVRDAQRQLVARRLGGGELLLGRAAAPP